MQQHCVVCGCSGRLTRHHIVPKRYFHILPPVLKVLHPLDVVPVCHKCHSEYEQHAFGLDLQVREYLGELNPIFRVAPRKLRISRFLLKHHAQLPQEALNCLLRYYGFGSLCEALDLVRPIGCEAKSLFLLHGQILRLTPFGAQRVIDLSRRHFIQKAHPRYLSTKWLKRLSLSVVTPQLKTTSF